MQRKVARIGPSTLMFSLPSTWVKEHGIRKGDSLDIIAHKDKLSISVGSKAKTISRVSVDLTGLNTSVAWYHLISAYRAGAEEITLSSTTPTIENDDTGEAVTLSDFATLVADNFIGMEIVRHHPKLCLIKEISIVKPEEFNTIQRKIFFSLDVLFDDIILGLQRQDTKQLTHLWQYGDVPINKLVHYCIRILSKTSQYDTASHVTLLSLEEIGDALKHLAQYLASHSVSKQLVKDINKLKQLFISMEAYYYKDTEKTLLAFKQCKRVVKQLPLMKHSKDVFISNVFHILLQLTTSIIHSKLYKHYTMQHE